MINFNTKVKIDWIYFNKHKLQITKGCVISKALILPFALAYENVFQRERRLVSMYIRNCNCESGDKRFASKILECSMNDLCVLIDKSYAKKDLTFLPM